MNVTRTTAGVAINLGLGEARTLVAGRERGAAELLRFLSDALDRAGRRKPGDRLVSHDIPVADQFRRRGR